MTAADVEKIFRMVLLPRGVERTQVTADYGRGLLICHLTARGVGFLGVARQYSAQIAIHYRDLERITDDVLELCLVKVDLALASLKVAMQRDRSEPKRRWRAAIADVRRWWNNRRYRSAA